MCAFYYHFYLYFIAEIEF